MRALSLCGVFVATLSAAPAAAAQSGSQGGMR